MQALERYRATDYRYIGQIPVRNIWLLMLYASDLFRQIGTEKIEVEDNPDDIPDLIAEFLTRIVERRLMRNLSFGYQEKNAVLRRIRGHIDLLRTERNQLLAKGKIACRYEDLTVNTPRNRFVKAALFSIAHQVIRSELARKCRVLADTLERIGVTGEKPSRSEISANQFGRNDADDKIMLSAAHLAFNLFLPTEASGSKLFAIPERDVIWMRRLFEKAVAGFYKVVLSDKGWQVDAGKTINWPIEGKTSGIDRILPSMRTDIELNHYGTGRRIVIDTKFTSILTKGWYREESLRSGYIYQIYSYLRSQEDTRDPLSLKSSGLLLHPSIGEMFDETAIIQGHAIRFATVDLNSKTSNIRTQLLYPVES
jgi:5-methylcytosine-specific restriction enzyme subunit McrC